MKKIPNKLKEIFGTIISFDVKKENGVPSADRKNEKGLEIEFSMSFPLLLLVILALTIILIKIK